MLRDLKILVLSSAIALAGGCSAAPAGEPLGQTDEAVTTICGASANGPVQGVDVSVYQGNFDWAASKAGGTVFGYARISDGTGTIDSTFDGNWANMMSAGVLRGAYQFFEPGEDATAQANLMVQKVGGQLGGGDLPCMIDVEVTGGQSGATILAKVQQWLQIVQAGTGKPPIIYTGPYFWESNVGGGLDNVSLWTADYGPACPLVPNGWTKWAFWQYSDGGGTLDHDVFNGTLAQLQNIGGSSPYGAQWVSQSFPLASSPLAMTAGQTISGDIELKNVGAKGWDTNTHLGTTQPRDRASVFADSSWLASNRPAGVAGTVPPGGTFKFPFNLHAPSKPGTYFEYFGVVEDQVAWFSDPGQGGPPDNQLEIQIVVTAAEYAGDFKTQSFPLAPAALSVHQGDAVAGFFELTNTGTKPWVAGVTKLAPTPRDKPSPLADAMWLSPTRVSTVAADVPPGSVGHFPVTLSTAGVGDYTQTFTLVEESVTWFADAPLGGGPPDDFLKVHMMVEPPGASLDASVPVVEGDGGVVLSADGGFGPTPGVDAGNPAPNQDAPGSSGGCGCKVASSSSGPGAPLGFGAFATLLGLVALRRRARSAF